MEAEDATAFVLLLAKLRKAKQKKKKNQRKHLVHPLLRDRSEKRLFITLYADLTSNPDKFLAFARMSLASFHELIQILKSHSMRNDATMRKSISPAEKVLVTLKQGCEIYGKHQHQKHRFYLK